MQIKFQIFKKVNRSILLLTFSVFATLITLNYYNYKNINEANIKNLINNIYFKNPSNVFNVLEPKYERIEHTILKGETLDSIFNRYSVNKKELEIVRKSLFEKNKINSLKVNDLLQFTIDRSTQNIIELSYPISKTKKISLKKSDDSKIFKEKIVTTKLIKKIIYNENIIMNSLYRSASTVGIPDSIIVEFARIYGFEIDFQRDIRKRLISNYVWSFFDEDEEMIEKGNILFANLNVQGLDYPLYFLIRKI